MKRFGILGVVVVALCGVGVAIVVGAGSKPSRQASVPGEALVQFRTGVTPSQAQQLIVKTGATLKEKIDPQQIYVVRFPLSVPPQEMLNRFRQMPEVVVAEPNGIYEVFSPENRKGG